jgi:hypothetical protein
MQVSQTTIIREFLPAFSGCAIRLRVVSKSDRCLVNSNSQVSSTECSISPTCWASPMLDGVYGFSVAVVLTLRPSFWTRSRKGAVFFIISSIVMLRLVRSRMWSRLFKRRCVRSGWLAGCLERWELANFETSMAFDFLLSGELQRLSL